MATTGTSQVILQRLREEQAQNQWRDRTWSGSAPTPKPPTPQPTRTPEPQRTVTATPATRRSGNTPAAPTSTPTPRPTRDARPSNPVRIQMTQPSPLMSSPGNYGMTLQDAGRQYQNTVAPRPTQPTSPVATPTVAPAPPNNYGSQPLSPLAQPTSPMARPTQPVSPVATPVMAPPPPANYAISAQPPMPPRPQQAMPPRPQQAWAQPTQQGISIDPQTGMRRIGNGGIGTILERGGGFAQRPSNLLPAQTSSDVLLRYLQQNPGDTEFLKRLQGILANPQPEGMQMYEDGFEYNTIGGNQRLTDVLAQYLAQLNGQQVQRQRGTSSR